MYSAREIALAAGVPEKDAVAALGGREFVGHADAVRVGQALVHRNTLFSMFSGGAASWDDRGTRLALSSSVHLGLAGAAIFVATLGLAPATATARLDDAAELMHLVFVATPGPGGGGGGGGALQRAPAPKAMLEGRRKLNSPVPKPEEPRPVEATPKLPDPLESKPVIAPIISAPADTRSRAGVLEEVKAEEDSQGPGKGGGAGTGAGTGLGAGDGSGIGPGSGGGIGGGPYRPGSGIEPPRVLREVKPDYTEEARRKGLVGDVVLEIVVRHDGSVGDIKILQGLGSGLDERAVQAVRQWRFDPATRRGTPVDVVVEVAVEFKLR